MSKETVTLNNGVEIPLVGLGTWDLRGELPMLKSTGFPLRRQ